MENIQPEITSVNYAALKIMLKFEACKCVCF